MNCPTCGAEIPQKEIAKAIGSAGGKKSRRTISKEAQDKMQSQREINRLLKSKGGGK